MAIKQRIAEVTKRLAHYREGSRADLRFARPSGATYAKDVLAKVPQIIKALSPIERASELSISINVCDLRLGSCESCGRHRDCFYIAALLNSERGGDIRISAFPDLIYAPDR